MAFRTGRTQPFSGCARRAQGEKRPGSDSGDEAADVGDKRKPRASAGAGPAADEKPAPGTPAPDQTPSRPPETGKQLFQNYPRTLRDLAIKARRFANSQLGTHVGESGAAPMRGAARGTPTKDDLLRISQGFWTRMRIRFKWFTIRGFRRFNVDDLSAFFTLGGLGTAILVIIGTTTFVSVIIVALHLLNLEEWIALRLARYLSAQTGMSIAFGSAIVPKWKEGRISFKDVVIVRRERPIDPKELHDRHSWDSSGDGTHVRVAEGQGPYGLEAMPSFENGEKVAPPFHPGEAPELGERPQPNFSMFELHVDSIDVQLSLSRWLDGRGLIQAADVRGVRGIVDRRSVFWDPEKPYDPRAARRHPKANDLDLDSFVIEDLLVTVYQPGGFRAFNFSIFTARIPRLRTQWLFYDLLNADGITGQLDGCLFSLHKPQSVSHTTSTLFAPGRPGPYQNWSRLRIDGVNVDHVQKMAGLTGPLLWIYSGRFDLVADIKFPRAYDKDVDINSIITELLDNLSGALAVDQARRRDADDSPIPGQPELSTPAIQAPVAAVGPLSERARQEQVESAEAQREREREEQMHRRRLRRAGRRVTPPAHAAEEAERRRDGGETRVSPATVREMAESTGGRLPQSVVIELDLRFKDIKASMPIFTRELSYTTYAFARPIVAFMNANKTPIPVHCRIVMDLSEFDGSMDLAQTGLLPLVSVKIYEALANHVSSQQANTQRVRHVSLWTLNITAEGLLRFAKTMRDAFAGNLPLSGATYS